MTDLDQRFTRMEDLLRMATLSYEYLREEHFQEGWWDRNKCPMCGEFHLGNSVEVVLEYHVRVPPHEIHDTFAFGAQADFDGQRTTVTRASEPVPIERERSFVNKAPAPVNRSLWRRLLGWLRRLFP